MMYSNIQGAARSLKWKTAQNTALMQRVHAISRPQYIIRPSSLVTNCAVLQSCGRFARKCTVRSESSTSVATVEGPPVHGGPCDRAAVAPLLAIATAPQRVVHPCESLGYIAAPLLIHIPLPMSFGETATNYIGQQAN